MAVQLVKYFIQRQLPRRKVHISPHCAPQEAGIELKRIQTLVNKCERTCQRCLPDCQIDPNPSLRKLEKTELELRRVVDQLDLLHQDLCGLSQRVQRPNAEIGSRIQTLTKEIGEKRETYRKMVQLQNLQCMTKEVNEQWDLARLVDLWEF